MVSQKKLLKGLLTENIPLEEENFPPIRQIGEVFGGEYIFNGESTWLKGSCATPKELESLLDTVENRNLREFILPSNWEYEKKTIYEKYGKRPTLWRGVRGPVTLAMSIYGVENLIYLMYDEPELATRFSEVITNVILEYIIFTNVIILLTF